MLIGARRSLLKSPAVVVASATTTWNPSDKHADITLSNGDLTATKGGTNGASVVRAVAFASSGKKYFESHCDAMNNLDACSVGIANASQSLSGIVGASANGCGYYPGGGIRINGSVLATGETWDVGATICVAVDLDNSRIWFRKNGGNWNNDGSANPATNTNGVSLATLAAGPYYAANTVFISPTDVFTANFGATTYAQTAPSGFGNW